MTATLLFPVDTPTPISTSNSTPVPGTPNRRRRRSLVGLVLTAVTAGVAMAASWPSSGEDSTRNPITLEGMQVEGLHSSFESGRDAVDRLDPDLLGAVRLAAGDAATSGIGLRLNSGWRSAAHQQRLLDEAVATHGSLTEALRWAATPKTSRHVTGDAVDVGPPPAAAWLHDHGADYGLCRTFANEGWHFELVTTPGGNCPPMQRDANRR
ncbi:M15 family metallopeptidase [Nocardioides yefusunii]|uniref:M15 family metallopeptidase n=1 Tax=Nocardioides yefusunii TaxID=2500546 RepID=A0ABW1QRQ6_9ACTN|nr:M15 family metallopeptidase [Nocardioides yefusunii]